MDSRMRHIRLGPMSYAMPVSILSTFVCCVVSVAQPAPRRETLIAVTREHVQSAALGQRRDVFVWLPDADAGPASRYPVLVMIDAQDQNNFRSLLANVRFLIDRKVIPPMLVLGVPLGASRDHDMTPMIKHVLPQMQQAEEIAGGADAMGRFIVDELLPWADGRYPTLPTRLLVGHSFGGLFVLYTAAMRPGAFRVVIAASPSLYPDGGAIGADIAARLAADSVHGRSIFVTSGDVEGGLDQSVTQFATALTSLVHDSSASHLAFRRQRYEATDHSMTPLSTVIDGLRWAYAPMRVRPTRSSRLCQRASPKTLARSWRRGMVSSPDSTPEPPRSVFRTRRSRSMRPICWPTTARWRSSQNSRIASFGRMSVATRSHRTRRRVWAKGCWP